MEHKALIDHIDAFLSRCNDRAKPFVRTESKDRIAKPFIRTESEGGVTEPFVGTKSKNGNAKPLVRTESKDEIAKPVVQTESKDGNTSSFVWTKVQFDRAVGRAIEIYRLPSKLASARARPLPPDVNLILRIAVQNEKNEGLLAKPGDATPADLQEAIEFYIQQVLLHAEADAYRILGVNLDAPREKIRANLALLLHWLHPDRNQEADRTIYLNRVLDAWEKVKTRDRRKHYDRDTLRIGVGDSEYANHAAIKSSNAHPKEKKVKSVQKKFSPAPIGKNGNPASRIVAEIGRPNVPRPGYSFSIFKWLRRVTLITFAVFVVTIFLAPNEMLLIAEQYWNGFLN